MKKLSLYISIICVMYLLCACGFFDYEYVSVEEYTPGIQMDNSPDDKIKVRNITSLKLAIQTIIDEGNEEGKIVFDAAYDGDPVADMSKACWQVRTQDALCAYCVADISYELSKIVTYYEAALSIGYTDYVDDVANIISMPFSTGIETIIRQALEEGNTKLVMLVDHSSYSAEDIISLVSAVYRQNPATAPSEPIVNVNMYSGANMQRLYEVNLRYGIPDIELHQRKAELAALRPFDQMEPDELDDAQRAFLAYEFLLTNCKVVNDIGKSTVYDALIEKKADSEGIALAYVELCRQLDVECIIVYGQHNWQDHCWNIIKAGDSYYHVDACYNEQEAIEELFMKTDEDFWKTYRWDMSSYPVCMPIPETDNPIEDENAEPQADISNEDQVEKPETFEKDVTDNILEEQERSIDTEISDVSISPEHDVSAGVRKNAKSKEIEK